MARSIAKNSLYNMLGNGLPMLVGLITIPRLVHSLGVDRFGILTLTWVVMGYFSLFDFGLGRALTQMVSERTGTGDLTELPDLIRTALVMMLLLGLVGGICLGAASPLIVGRVLKMSPALRMESLYAFGLMALSVPTVTVLAGIRGILEARQRFLELSLLRLGMGVLTFVGPWLVTLKTVHLFWVVMSLEVMRSVFLLAHYAIWRWYLPELSGGTFQARYWKKLIRFGGWMTVSNIITPLMGNLDRFFIGALVTVSAIAYYATPFDMITKLSIIPFAIVTVLFPMFGSLYQVDLKEADRIYRKGLRTIFFILAPLLLVVSLGAKIFMVHWLGPEFALRSSPILRVLCLGVMATSLGAVPYAFIQGAARPDLTAKFHLAEAPIYLGLLWFLGTRFGALGVAWAWTIRVCLDLTLLVVATRRLSANISGLAETPH